MVRFALVLTLLANLLLNALPASAQNGSPTAGLGTAVQIYNTSLQVVGEVSVLDVVDPFQEYDLTSGQPQRGHRWVMATVSLKAGDQPLNTNSAGYFQLIDSEGYYVSQTYVARSQESIDANPDFNSSNITAEAEATGAVFVQVFGWATVDSIYYSPDYTQWIMAADLRESSVAPGDVVSVMTTDGSPLGEVSLLGVLDPLEDYDPSYAPQRGFRYVGVAVSFTNTTTRPYTLDSSRFDVSDREGFAYSSSGIYRTPEGEASFPSLSYLEVAPGATVSGIVSIEIINGAMVKEVTFSPIGDRRIRLAEYGPDDVYTPPTMAAVPMPTPEATADPA
jgi:hypothetical protein